MLKQIQKENSTTLVKLMNTGHFLLIVLCFGFAVLISAVFKEED